MEIKPFILCLSIFTYSIDQKLLMCLKDVSLSFNQITNYTITLHYYITTPLGIFWSKLKTGLWSMRCFALKKCMDGGNGLASISCCFSFWSFTSSSFSLSFSGMLPPVRLDASSLIRASRFLGSGPQLHDAHHRNSIHIHIRSLSVTACMAGMLFNHRSLCYWWKVINK